MTTIATARTVTTSRVRERRMFPKRAALLLLAFCGTLVHWSAAANPMPVQSSTAGETEAEAIDAVYSLDFDEAESKFVALAEQDPGNSRMWNLLASSIWLKIVFEQEKLNLDAYSSSNFAGRDPEDLVSPEREARLRSVLARSISEAQAILDGDPDNLEALYALGIAYGSLASFEAMIKRAYLAANSAAGKAREHHMRLLELDPSYNDARLTIGAYDYTVGALPAMLRFIIGVVGIRGDKEAGIEQLEYAAELGDRGSTNAKVVLTVVYNREKQYDRSLALLEELHSRYPRNFMFELEKASVYQRMEEWAAAVSVYENVVAKVRTGTDGYDRLEAGPVLFRMAETHIHGMDNDSALEVFDEILSSPDSTETLQARSRLWMGKIHDSRGERMRALDQYGLVLTLEAPEEIHDEARRYTRRPFES